MHTPTLLRRLGSLLYEALVFVAIWMLAAAIFTTLIGAAGHGWQRGSLQLFSFLLVSMYFLWCWTHGGQTLAMRTWRIRLLLENGAPVPLSVAVVRYLLAWAALSLGGLGVWWALLDRDGQFLHDRLARTRLASVD